MHSDIPNIEEQLKRKGRKLSARANRPMAANYLPETYSSNEISLDGITTFKECIGNLRLAIVIGRAKILTEVPMLSSY